MAVHYEGELRFIAQFSNRNVFELPVESGFRVLYEAIRHELRAIVGRSLFYDYTYCDVYIAYVVERWDDEGNFHHTQKCFEQKIGQAFASCIDRHTCFDYRRE